jgi:nitroreductase
MSNQAVTIQTSSEIEFPVLEVIQNRRSKRAYSAQSVESEKIKSLFEAARWAPSAVNEQPWIYLYATSDQPLWQTIFETLHEGNQLWSKDAPLLIVSLLRKEFSRNGKVNASAKYDVGAANAFLSLQATALGLNVHQMGGYDAQLLRGNLHIPDVYEPVVIMAVGYPGNTETLPAQLQVREMAPRMRMVQDEFVMNKLF